MKQHEAERVIQEARRQFAHAIITCEIRHVRRGNTTTPGYRVTLLWAGRTMTIGKVDNWASMQQAWRVLAER